MGSLSKSEEALVLAREPSGENHLKLRLLCRGSGLVLSMQRLPRGGKTPKNPVPDLFDRIEVTLNAPKTGGNGLYFMGECHIARRHPGLGKQYNRLKAAGDYALLLIRNATHLEDHDRLFTRTNRFFEILEVTHLPQAAYLKALFLFLREEGYPLKEDWWKKLPPSARNRATHYLNDPLESITLGEPGPETILDSLLQWTREHTDILV